MSLDARSVHVRLRPEIYDKLNLLAGVRDLYVAECAAGLLEKMIVGEFHMLSLHAERLDRLGLTGKNRDKRGFTGRGPC